MIIVNSRFRKIKRFLERENFDGFTQKDLFIKNFMPNAWGQDIAALSNMAEALRNLGMNANDCTRKVADLNTLKDLLSNVVKYAVHPTVNPWKKPIEKVSDFNHYGYYLEHLNIILGCYQQVVDDRHFELNERITQYLAHESLIQPNAHARLIPHIKMRWSADQAAIIYSLWLFDQNNGTHYHVDPKERWINYMNTQGKHPETGLYVTEVMRTKRYSLQPRGCSHAYMCYYMEHFAPGAASEQWALFNEHMSIERLGLSGYREYLPGYKGKWTPDSGPIVFGIGVAATGLALKPMRVWGVENQWHPGRLLRSARCLNGLFSFLSRAPFLGRFFLLGCDMLATSILLAAETTEQKYI